MIRDCVISPLTSKSLGIGIWELEFGNWDNLGIGMIWELGCLLNSQMAEPRLAHGASVDSLPGESQFSLRFDYATDAS